MKGGGLRVGLFEGVCVRNYTMDPGGSSAEHFFSRGTIWFLPLLYTEHLLLIRPSDSSAFALSFYLQRHVAPASVVHRTAQWDDKL